MKKQGKNRFIKELEQPPIRPYYVGGAKLQGKVAIITGGDSGIGRSVALYFAREGADVVINYHSSDKDAAETARMVENEGRECLLIKGDISKESFCKKLVDTVKARFKKINILVNNAGMHQEDTDLKDVSRQQLERTFEVNVYSIFYLVREALKHMKEGDCIINTASVVAYRGSDHLIDYASTKGAIVAFTRSLSSNLSEKKIRVNAVAPGPVWTPLVIEAFEAAELEQFGKKTPMGRAGYPYELGPAYVYLACEDSSYVTGQVIHVNGGEAVNG